MNTYTYAYLDQKNDGRKREGTIDAPSEKAALRKLHDEGLTPLYVQKVKDSKTVDDYLARLSAIKVETKADFARQFASLFAAGVPPVRILNTLREAEANGKFKDVLADLARKVQDGVQLSAALRNHPDVFDDMFCGMVQSGEESGKLDVALKTLATQLEKAVKLKRAIKSATMYPKVVTGGALLILSLLLGWMVPKFAKVFEEAILSTNSPGPDGEMPDTSLPWPTRVVQTVGKVIYPQYGEHQMYMSTISFGKTDGFEKEHQVLAFLVEMGLRIGVFVIILMLVRRAIRAAKKREDIAYKWDLTKLRLPMKIGKLVQKITMARFARTFASLLEAGIPAPRAMELTSEVVGNKVVADAVLNARKELLNGNPMVTSLRDSDGAFPPQMCAMVETGEEAGNIEEMLLRAAEDYEEQVDAQIKALNSIIEPLMLMGIGGIIGVIVIAIYLPMFALYDRIGTGSVIAPVGLELLRRRYAAYCAAADAELPGRAHDTR